MSALITIILTLVIFGVLIFVHEFGHLIFAKINHIYVEEFSVGMGTKIFGFKKGETQYNLRIFPIGGYCKMPGEDGESEHPNGFDKKSVPRRFLVVFGGAFFNFIFAILLFVVAFMLLGAPATTPLIGDVYEDYPAYKSGISAGDTITSVNGVNVDTWTEFSTAVNEAKDEKIAITAKKENGETYSTTVTPVYNEESGNYVIGVVLGSERQSLFNAIKLGLEQTYTMTKGILVALVQMITGTVAVDLSGPVGVGQMVGQVMSYGFVNLLLFAGMLSVNLGIINLLPLPALDGSRLVFLIIEGIRRKKISPKIEGTIHLIGMMLLLILMVVVTFSDISKLWG